MNLENIGTRLASAPERMRDAIPRLVPLAALQPRRSWAAGEAIAAFGLGIAVGVAIGLMLHGPAGKEELELADDPGE